MEIRRFYSTQIDEYSGAIQIEGDEFVHMTKVLRYKVGYKAVVFANNGFEYDCTVKEIGRDFAVLGIDSKRAVDKKNVRLVLYAGLLKNNKLDLVVQKGVELGVDEIIPFTSANCAESKFSKERANKIALESAKQCGAVYLSKVNDLISFEEVVNQIKLYDRVIIANENERERTIPSVLKKCRTIALIIGPEGGFKASEINAAREAGAISVTLGKRILRAETASIITSALVLYGIGELSY